MAEHNQPIRVAQIVGKVVLAGVDTMVMNYYRHIDRSKVQFDFFMDGLEKTPIDDEILDLGGKIFKLPPYEESMSANIGEFRKILRQTDYKIIHCHMNTLSVFWLREAKRAGVPIRIAHSHSTAGKGETARNILKCTLRPFSKVFPTHFCACSEYAGRWLFGDRLYDSGKVKLIKNAIDISTFTFDPQVREIIRKELGIENKLVIGHVGRFMKQKNHSFLIDIFNQVQKREPDSVLLLVGGGELEQEIQDKVSSLGLKDSVWFLGVRNDVHRLLQGMDVFLLPSLYEGLPVVGIEAQASGLKMVASDAVTKEAKIIESFAFMSLSQSAKEWAERAMELSSDDRGAAVEQVVGAGYEIGLATGELARVYVSYVS